MDQPERNSENKAQVEARTQRVISELNQWLDNKIREIETDQNKTPEQKTQEKSNLAEGLLNELKEADKSRDKLQKDAAQGKEISTEKMQKADEDVHKKMIQVVIAADKDLDVVQDKKAQSLLKELIKTKPNETQAVEIMDYIGPWITGEQPIVFGEGETKSDFQKAVNLLAVKDSEAAKKLIDSMAARPSNFGLDEAGMRDKFKVEEVKAESETPSEINKGERINENIPLEVEREMINSNRYTREDIEDADLGEEWRYSQELFKPKFSQDQIKFLKIFYTPKRFKAYVENERQKVTNNKESMTNLKENITEIYKKVNNGTAPSEETINGLVQDKITQNVSQGISSELTKVLNQLYIRMQLERPQKFFEEVEGEDFLRGIKPTNIAIKNALQKLNTNIAELISKKDQSFDNLKFAVNKEKPYYVQERSKDGKMQPYLRNVPMPYFETVGINTFLQNLQQNFDHWIHRESYLHDVRASFNQPPGEKGFYGGLAGYAEKISGTDIDEMMLLPDGNLVYQAFVLYDKIVEEEFASQDWKHRTNQFTNKLEYINTQLEQDVVDRLKELYGNLYSESQIINAKNSAVGMARGVFLTEPEKSAYADPTDVEGTGMIGSYATNDAGALNVFNPLHTITRWQGEYLMNMIYFMPLEGKKGAWNHTSMWKNMNAYFDSYTKGKGKLPERVFIDEMIDIGNVGGPGKRRGWRMQHSLEGHFIFSQDGKLDPLETFKAMDVIGYEAIVDFLNNRLDNGSTKGILQAKDGTPLGDQKNKLFRYMYDKYFQEFDKNTSYESYMKDLQKEGKIKVFNIAKKSGSLPIDSIEEQINKEIANIFIERLISREVAARFPTKFLRMDRDRFTKDGVSNWRYIYEKYKNMISSSQPGFTRDNFNTIMKDLNFAEMLLRTEISKTAKERLNINNNLTLNQVSDIGGVLSETKIRELFLQVKDMSPDRIENAVNVYKLIRSEYFENKETKFFDKRATELIKGYTFTLGLEDSDFTLMSFRGAGPRMVARAVGDTAQIEREVIPTIIKMGQILNDMAINGKHDFSTIIEYLRKAQDAFVWVHETGASYDFNYKIASMVINYFKKDTVAKPLFGLFGMGRKNSIASEYAGRSTSVWEWDSRDIDRFCTALESYRLLPLNPYDNVKKGAVTYEDRYIINPLTKKPMKLPSIFRKRTVDWKVNSAKLRKEHGGDKWAMLADTINTLLPIIGLYLLYEYIKKSLEEAEGKKK